MAIYLIRHGETADNKRRVLQMPDSELSETGIEQANALGDRLSNQTFGKILTSDYLRTVQTAAAINRHHDISMTYEPLLRERHFGDWRGKSYDELGKDRLNAELSPPNGEDKPTFFKRVADAWQTIQQHAQQSAEDLVVVSHGLFCKALVQNHLALPEGLALPERWTNTSVTIIEKQSDWTVTRLNCADHLDD